MSEIKKLIWAVDVLAEKENQSQAVGLLRALASRTKALVEPVCLLIPSGIMLSATDKLKWDKAFRSIAEERMLELVKSSEISTIEPGTILFQSETSTREAVRRMVEYAKEKNADAIVVSTHARSGLPRLFLGSFAETLLLQSDVPVITINPDAQIIQNVSQILYPTDFGQPSRRGFETTVKLAKQVGATLTLFFKQPPLIIPPYVETPMMAYDNYFEAEAKSRKVLAQGWIDWANKQGVNTIVAMDEKPGEAAPAIAEFAASKGIDLISMVSEASRGSAIVLGSVTRQVIRNAQCPVWAQHSKA